MKPALTLSTATTDGIEQNLHLAQSFKQTLSPINCS